ncbi:Histidinol-phosphate aminotransferase [Candidatus Bealeia paramacronuclearis]|uniref:Histidinol-phosphate aminotransferase n=1 Tax=Candidatus Bealeia paramacronuclearis TaxID=1921001 RepID=A0ABZ2C6I1_9PROT
MSHPRAHAPLFQIQPFTTSGHNASNASPTIDLTTNEETLGPSPRVLDAYQNFSTCLHHYPDVTAQDLRKAIARQYGIPFENLICGNGSEEFLYALPRAFCAFGDEVIFSKGSFPVYKIATQCVGAIPVETAPQDFRIDIEAILKAITPRTKLIFIDNPGNPYSTYLRQDEIEKLIENTPPSIVIALDGAYSEYVTARDFTSGLEFVKTHPNVIILRTFSKFYGLAGLRVGWAYGSVHLIEPLLRLKAPFNVGTLAQRFAIIALQDQEHAIKVRTTNHQRRTHLKNELETLGFDVPESQCNFLSPGLVSQEKIKDLVEFLFHEGISVRSLAGQGFPNRFRFSLSVEENMRTLIDAISNGLVHKKKALSHCI